jgi:hypothetical protein
VSNIKLDSIIFLILISSCNENFSGGSRVEAPPEEEEQIAPKPQEFRTRLNSTLLIEGIVCRGDETTEPYGNGSLCSATQYLVYIDNINICDEFGRCTDYVVIPIVAALENIDAGSTGFSTFIINPKSPVTSTQKNILDNVLLTSDINGNGTVIFK